MQPLEKCTGDHEREGYSGNVYYAETKNMICAEDELLSKRSYLYNTHKLSNQPEGKGYVYLIHGRRYKTL